MSLEIHRKALHESILDLDLNDEDQGNGIATAFIKGNWREAQRLIANWWGAYKDWERVDTFSQAVADHRMTMRSWGGDDPVQQTFAKLVNKTGKMNIATEDRFYANSDRQPLPAPPRGMTPNKDRFAATVEPPLPKGTFGWGKGNPKPPVVYGPPVRGINSAAFMLPANFVTREQKYRLGLNDTSVTTRYRR